MFGHFFAYAPVNIEYAINRSVMEVKRLFDVLDRHLKNKTWLVGEQLTIADFVVAPWFNYLPNYGDGAAKEFAQLDSYKNVNAWLERWNALEGVKRGKRVNGFGKDAVPERHSAADFDAKL